MEATKQTSIILRKRAYISLLVWFGNVSLWIIIAIIRGTSINEARRASGIFWLLFFLFYGIQVIPYWLLLKKNNEEKPGRNIALVIAMPFLILGGIWLFFLFGGAVSSGSLK